MRNVVLFIGSLLGSGLLIAGIVALADSDGTGWLYIIGALASFLLAYAPGRLLRDTISPPDA